MSSVIIKRRRKAFEELSSIFEKSSMHLIIHYSCESFYDETDGRTPRITSIAVRNLDSAQTRSFSIHSEAELVNTNVHNSNPQYDTLEKSMLDNFFAYIKKHEGYHYVHWNMRDENYGFQAIERRYKILKGDPIIVSDSNKHDLSRILISIYGKGYIAHPRLEKLIKKNKIADLDFMTGAEEAKAFEKKEFLKLHQSTLRKVDIFANIAQLAYEKNLKTNATRKEMCGGYLAYFGEGAKNHWAMGLVTLILGAIAGATGAITIVKFFFGG